jgi:hypothetical protein
MSTYICTGCEDFTVESNDFPERPCPNCGYIGEGEYGNSKEQYRRKR